MRQLILIFSLGLIFFSSCRDNDEGQASFTIDKPINFQSLEVGQKMAFVNYKSQCVDISSEVDFGGDTIILEVMINHDNEEFVISEYYTPYSESVVDITPVAIQYSIHTEGDFIRIPERFNSQIFWFYANDTIRLQPENTINLSQVGCQLQKENDVIFVGNEIGRTPEFKIDNRMISNKLTVSCEPYFDLDGYLFYDETTIYGSHVTYFLSENFNGWIKYR